MQMRLEELKKGFWGYKKEGVFQYLAELEQTYSQKLQERDERSAQAERQAQARLQTMEEENRSLKEELSGLRKQYDQISAAILDARTSAEAMKAETRAQEAAARETVRENLEADLSELERYRERVSALREDIHRALQGLEDQAEVLEQRVSALYEEAPQGNLTLFE